MSTIGAVVAYAPDSDGMKWKYEQIPAPRQPKDKELLIRMVSVGICHTDIFVSHIPSGVMGLSYPKVLGHEGAGYVEAIGPGVTTAAVGDPVLLSYNYCGACDICKSDQVTYCEDFGLVNIVGEASIHKSTDNDGPAAKFFGQSSFAALSVVDEKSVVNVKNSLQSFEELKRCAPLGCGLMTGAGAAINNLKSHDIMLVIGLGAVGMGAIMAAKQVGIRAIIAVDRIDSRLQIAKELGATHTYDTSNKELDTFVEDVQTLVSKKRISFAIDTTGFTPIIEKGILALGRRGKMLQIGVPGLESQVNLQMGDFFQQSKVYESNLLGDVKAGDLVPKMIEWYKQGKFPIDRIIQFYHIDKVHEALEDMKTKVIKPILVF